MRNPDEDDGVAICFFLFICLLLMSAFACFMDLGYKIDYDIQRYYHKDRVRAAINQYHDDMQRQLAISKTQVELLEMEQKLKSLTTT
jgi:hypothetical protein